MKLMILSSKHFYNRIPEIKNLLENQGHKLKMPNSYDNHYKELKHQKTLILWFLDSQKIRICNRNLKVMDFFRIKKLDGERHIKWKGEMMRKDEENINPQDAVLVLNFEKKGIPNYIGGATFLEVYTAWKLNKKIFFYNPLPKCSFTDELIGINPTIINGNLNLIK